MDKGAHFEILPAADFNEVQAMLVTEVTAQHESNWNVVSVINSCGWPIGIRIICDDLDIGEQFLGTGKMCHFSFHTNNPSDTLVFCQTWGEGRNLSFDAWGGTAPRGLNVWSLLPDTEMGLALNGVVKKGWSITDCKGFEDDLPETESDMSDEDSEYFHKSRNHHDCFAFPNATGGPDAHVPNSQPELII